MEGRDCCAWSLIGLTATLSLHRSACGLLDYVEEDTRGAPLTFLLCRSCKGKRTSPCSSSGPAHLNALSGSVRRTRRSAKPMQSSMCCVNRWGYEKLHVTVHLRTANPDDKEHILSLSQRRAGNVNVGAASQESLAGRGAQAARVTGQCVHSLVGALWHLFLPHDFSLSLCWQ